MIKKQAIFFFVIILISFASRAQSYKNYLIDSCLKKNTDSIALDFCHNIWGDTIDNSFFTTFHIIYLTCSPILNYTYLNDSMVDTTMFTKEYFCSGQFLKDYINKDSEKCLRCKHYFMESRPYLYDKYNSKCYEFKLSEWINRNNCNTSINIKKFIIESGKFEQFIGKLISNGILDCVFAYPTDITKSDGYQSKPVISTQLGVFFGLKDDGFYIIYDNWTEENQGNNPLLFTIDDFIDCCWDKISNVKLK